MIQTIEQIEKMMAASLSDTQARELHVTLVACLCGNGCNYTDKSIEEFIGDFLYAKRLEGCSERSIRYYRSTLCRFADSTHSLIGQITTDEIRCYLAEYRNLNGAGNITIDNIRRVLSSFFSWLEEEDFIYKSPVRRIKKIRSTRMIKPVYSDESLEDLRDACANARDLAIIDLLASTGIRVGELVKLNRSDMCFESRECVVRGKGDKERKVYFDARTKVHLQAYLEERTDDNDALFVSINKPFRRLEISGVELRLRHLGKAANVLGVHPHKFRRTLATRAIDKGMPIEQVQVLLGHSKIDTTLCYAMVDQANVKQSHRKYIA